MLYDYENTIDYAREEGHLKGLAEGKLEKALEVAKTMIAKGFSTEDISELTGLAMTEIDKLM